MAEPGDTLGPYVVEALLARGGMGAVYRARNRVTGQLRAIKIVRPEIAKDADFADRFVREASIASQLQHPNLVETFEPGIDGDTIYLPMELLEGETLAARLRRVHRLPAAEAAAILLPIAEAVQLLHDRGLVHRDLKPTNVFLARTESGEIPKVIDLGTARDVGDDEHTRTGVVIGSPFYMALEQAEGRRDIDGRADQYALAVIAYQLITGTRPYESDDTRSAIAKLLRGDDYVPPSRVVPGCVPTAIERAIVRGLERDRDRRFGSILELGRAIHAGASDAVMDAQTATRVLPASDPPMPATTITSPPGTTTRRVWAVVAALLGAIAITGAAAWAMETPATTVTELPIEPSTPIAAPAPAHEPAPTQAHAHAPTQAPAPAPTPAPAHASALAPAHASALAPPPAEPITADPEPAPRERSARPARRPRRSRGRSDDAPCGATTGIPCVD